MRLSWQLPLAHGDNRDCGHITDTAFLGVEIILLSL